MQGIISNLAKISPGSSLEKFLSFYEPRTIRRSSFVTVESAWGQNQISNIAPDIPSTLVEYGASKKFFDLTRNLSPTPTFVYVGSLSFRKGIDILAKAFSDPRLADVRLKVLGDGELRQLLEECPGKVEVLGRVGQEKVMELLGSSWGLIHPTRADTSPNSVKEARVAGLAVITTEAGGQTQYVEDGKNGFFFDLDNPESLIEAVLNLSSDRNRALEMGAYQKEENQEMLEPFRTAKTFYQLYRKMASEAEEAKPSEHKQAAKPEGDVGG